MIDKNQKLSILEEILKSNSFINSKLNSKLLTYLVECEISNKTPSEYSIALDVFQKDSGFNPNEDTLVRVSVYNLRKKLERYYQNMGKKTKLRVKIPKGQYEVKFFNYQKENYRERITNPYLLLGSIITILLIVILYLISILPKSADLQKLESNNSKFANIFSSLTNSQNPKLVTLGDDFIYYSDFSEFKTTSVRKMYRNSNINSEEQFEKFKSEDSSKENLKKLPFSFFNQAAVWPLPYLVNILDELNTEYIIKSTTALNSNDLKAHDIIFLGSYWTLGILENVITDLGIDYNIIGKEEFRLEANEINDSSIVYERTGVPAFDHIDYCTFIKIPGPSSNILYLFVSFYATGTVGAIKYITNEKDLENLNKTFESKFEIIPEYYYVVIKANGYNREVLSTELLHVEEIKPEMISW